MISIKIILSFIFLTAVLANNYKFNQPFIDVAKSANPSVVSIITEFEVTQRPFNPFFNDPFFEEFFPEFTQRGQTLGSGVIIDKEGIEDWRKEILPFYESMLLDFAYLQVEILLPDEEISGDLKYGELKLLQAPFESLAFKLTPSKGLDVGAGKNEILKTKVFGGVVGIILDGRGRQPFNLTEKTEKRVSQLKEWSEETNEYPQLENSNV